MGKISHTHGTLIIGFSFIVALMLTVVPLPDWVKPLRPEWVGLALIYWAIALPHRVGVGTAWTLGLMLDVLKGGILGQHGLALAVIVYLILKVHQQFRVYPLWQQALIIGALILLNQMLILWINGIVGLESSGWSYWLPSLSSALLWPWMFIILRDIRRHFVAG
ncbi:MAG TPA: rod shape-determining protein MreD [Candidatus Tenderia sp.]|nr:rod shape-determining protein MreD [Candidatus Tenderia sp.]